MRTLTELHGGWSVTQETENGFHVVRVSGPGKSITLDHSRQIEQHSFPKFVRKFLKELFGIR